MSLKLTKMYSCISTVNLQEEMRFIFLSIQKIKAILESEHLENCLRVLFSFLNEVYDKAYYPSNATEIFEG